MSSTPIMEPVESRKVRGAFFTPEPLVEFMVEWAVRSVTDKVLEPSCGEAAFILEVSRSLMSMGALVPDVTGYDIHGPSLARAKSLLAEEGLLTSTMEQTDFFDVRATPVYDVVVGNPPYLRYQDFAGDARDKGLEAVRDIVPLSGLANAWAAFVVHAAQFLTPHGRLALVLPAALLAVGYAAPVREYLMRRFASVQLIMFKERVFPGVQEEVVLLLAEGAGEAPHLEVTRLQDASGLSNLAAERSFQVVLGGGGRQKWTSALLGDGAGGEFEDLLGHLGFETLGDWGKLELGTVTGANRYFALTQGQMQEYQLSKEDVVPISPAGSKHLSGLSFTTKAHQALVKEGRAAYLFYPRDTPSSAAQAFIKEGEARSVHEGYKCRNRSVWWKVPLTKAPDLIFTYMSAAGPRVIANEASVHILNSLHGILLKDERRDVGMRLLPLAMFNSATLLSAELVGRSYGGGVLKLEPTEARRLAVPSLEVLRDASGLDAAMAQAIPAIRRGDMKRLVGLVDEQLLVGHLGLHRSDVRNIRERWLDLQGRRKARGRSPK